MRFCLALAVLCASSMAAAANVPSVMYQCEADQCTRGGGGAVWLFEGPRGQAMWHYTAIASLTVTQFDGRTITIHREDPNPSYSSPRFADKRKRRDGVFFADYYGTIEGNRVVGTVTWNGGGHGNWYATLSSSVCGSRDTCPLDPRQLVQLGQNTLRARLYRSALRTFLGAADKGDSDGQTLAGAMLRDGVGAPRDTARALDLMNRSANQGNPNGALALAETYQYGLGVPADPQKAAAYREQAAQRRAQLQAQQQANQNQARMGQVLLIGLFAAAMMSIVSADGGGTDDGEEAPRGSSNIPNAAYREEQRQRQERNDSWTHLNGPSAGSPPVDFTGH